MFDDVSELERAKYKTIRDFEGGAAALAPLIGIKNSGVLNNKVNPHNDTHHLTVDESIAIQAITQDFQILCAQARTLGHVCLRVPTENLSDTSDLELLDCWSAWQADTGETAQTIRDALSDRKISKKELVEIRREIFEDIARELELLQRLEAISES